MPNVPEYSRRDFIAMAGLVTTTVASAGCARSAASGGRMRVGAANETELTASGASAPQSPEAGRGNDSVPMRPFGNRGVDVSALALGGYFDALAHPQLLDRALELGVTYWETTTKWGGRGYGAYFSRNPDVRDRVFLLAKARQATPEEMEHELHGQLEELETDYIDFYIAGAISDVALLDDDVRRWVDASKRSGRIRYFGFSTHKNMAVCLNGAVKLGWIDGVVTTYNYRLMQEPEMQDAIGACAEQGIAITSIKSQALSTNPAATVGEDSEAARELLHRLASTGLSEQQAKLMAVWSEPAISSICSMMPDESILLSNVHASTRWHEFSHADGQALARARAGSRDYCAGCGTVCESTIAGEVPIADIMRYLMYARSYDDPARAREAFQRIPLAKRRVLDKLNYRTAEARCPRGLAIGALMKQACVELE